MNASHRALRALLSTWQAAERIATRYKRDHLTAHEALQIVERCLDPDHQQAMELPVPTAGDLFDALRQVDAAHVDIEISELRVMTHLKVRYGASWPQISEARGFASRQAAQDRFKTLANRYPGRVKEFDEEARKAATQQTEGAPK